MTTEQRTRFVDQSADLADLQAWFRHMRHSEPVSWEKQYGTWHVFRYADISQVLADPVTYSSDLTELVPPQEEVDLFNKGNFVRMDPPQHAKMRKLVSRAFTPRVITELAPRITAIVAELLDAETGQAEFDLVAGLAYPLPVTVIAELIGVPAADRERFKRWADALLTDELPDTLIPDEATMQARGSRLRDMIDYLLAHIRHRRANPTTDLTSTLIAAEVDGEHLDDDEIVGFIGLLLIAGHITTTTLLTNAVLTLQEHPDVARALRADPDLIPAALEEVLRVRAPFPRLVRRATVESTIAGRTVPAGAVLSLWIGSANLDEQEVADPERFDLDRSPNPHLSFGHGIHFCIGAPLARLEGRIALRMLLERCGDLSVADGVVLHDARIMSGARRLPVRVTWTG